MCTHCKSLAADCTDCSEINSYCTFCRYCSHCQLDHHAGINGRILRATLRDVGPIALCSSHTVQHCDHETKGCSVTKALAPIELARYRFKCRHCLKIYKSEGDRDKHRCTHSAAVGQIVEPKQLQLGPPPGWDRLTRELVAEGQSAPLGPPSQSELPPALNPVQSLPGGRFGLPDLPVGPQELQYIAVSCSVCHGIHEPKYYDCPTLCKIKAREVTLSETTCKKCLCLKTNHRAKRGVPCFLGKTGTFQWNLLCGTPGHPDVHYRICHECPPPPPSGPLPAPFEAVYWPGLFHAGS